MTGDPNTTIPPWIITDIVPRLRAAGWTVTPPPDPKTPCYHCGKPHTFAGPCIFGGCPLGADL